MEGDQGDDNASTRAEISQNASKRARKHELCRGTTLFECMTTNQISTSGALCTVDRKLYTSLYNYLHYDKRHKPSMSQTGADARKNFLNTLAMRSRCWIA